MGNNTSFPPSEDEIKIDNRKKYRDQANPNKSSSKLFEANYIPVTIFHDQGSQTVTKKDTKQKQPMHTKFIKFVILAFVLYLIFVISFATSSFCQGLLLYLNIARIPLGDLTDLSSFGLLGARNINFTTEDGLTLKGYHLLPTSQVQDLIQKNQYSSADFDELLANANNIIMYFHGNGATRAMSMRLEVIKKLSTFTDSHVITFDYRGFGDSPGWPSELGTFLDAKAAIHWVDSVVKKYNPDAHGYFPADELFEKKNSKKNTILSLFNRIFHPTLSKTSDHHNSVPLSTNQTCHTGNVTQPKLFLYGHSLGTGILMPVAVAFNKANKNAITGVILDCPFTSIKAATNDHPSTTIFRIVPYFRELMYVSDYIVKIQYNFSFFF